MTISKHAVTAELNVGSGYTLDVVKGRITLDDAWAPYVQADLTIHTPDEAVLDLLDPRDSVRVVVSATKEFGDWNSSGAFVDQERVFNLLLRSREVDHVTGTTLISLASDEAMLQDFALVDTDPDRIYGLSVKDAVEYALGKISAMLEAGAADGDIANTVTEPVVTNLLTNPSFETNITNAYNGGSANTWGTGASGTVTQSSAQAKSGSKSLLYSWTSSATADVITYFGQAPTAPDPATAGTTYRGSIWVRCSKTQRLAARLAFTNSSGLYISEVVGTEVIVAANTWTRLDVSGVAPATTTGAYLLARASSSGAGYSRWANGDKLYVDALMVTAGDNLVDYFDGDTVDTDLIEYAWTGTAHASTSTRTYLPNSDAMIWQPGVTAWDWLEPLLQVTGLRLYCDEARKWWLETAETPREGVVSVSSGFNAIEATDAISRTSESWFDAVVIAYTKNVDENGKTITVYDATDPGTLALKLEYDRPSPGPGAAAAVLARAQGRGRVLKLKSGSNYNAAPGMTLVATLPNSPIQTGVIASIEWVFPDDRMTIGSRGLTDTPETSWLLAADGLAWEDVADGVAWNEYTP